MSEPKQLDTSSVGEFETAYAGFWIRLFATLIDSALMLLLFTPLLLMIYGNGYWLGVGGIQGIWDFAINWILPAVLVVGFWEYRQATPGKLLFRTAIVDAKTGDSPDFRQWVVRYLGYFLSTVTLGLGFLWVIGDRRKQGWHDKLAGTVVVRRKRRPRVRAVEFSDTRLSEATRA